MPQSAARRPPLRLVHQTAAPAVALSDTELTTRLRHGEAGLGAELCGRLMRVVDATLYRVLGGRDVDHEDLVQASFEQIVRSLAKGRYAGECNLSTWAAAITCHVGLHAIRRRKVERKIFDPSLGLDDLDSLGGPASDPESSTSSKQKLDRVRFHLSQMSEKLSQALLMSDFLGCTQAEIAKLLAISEPAAQARLFRGRRELAARLERDESTAYSRGLR